MVYNRRFIYPSLNARQHHLRGRLYPSTGACKPMQALIPIMVHGGAQIPVPDGLFQQANIQPYIHNCQVTILEGTCKHQFTVFFKNHCRLTPNLFLPRNPCHVWAGCPQGRFFHGDIVVLRMGLRKPLTSMRGRDSSLADYAVKRFVKVVHIQRRLPTSLQFRKIR